MAFKNDISSMNISYILRQRFTIEFCVKLGKMGEKLLDMLQSMYGTEAKVELQCFIGETVLKTEIKGWLTTLEVGDQAMLLQM
jgi:hypothetical protein